MQPQPMIAVTDVPASSRWYQQVLGARSGHGREEYEQIVDAGGRMLLQLHDWNIEGHPHLGDPQGRPYGNGALLWLPPTTSRPRWPASGNCRPRSSKART